MNVCVYLKGDYEDFHALDRRKNKANSKPNKANPPAFGRKSETRRMENLELKIWNFAILHLHLSVFVAMSLFEKTKPICRRDISA